MTKGGGGDDWLIVDPTQGSVLLDRLPPSTAYPRPATCMHRCDCSHHAAPDVVKHVMACCTDCGKGHEWIKPMFLKAHLEQCHNAQ